MAAVVASATAASSRHVISCKEQGAEASTLRPSHFPLLAQMRGGTAWKQAEGVSGEASGGYRYPLNPLDAFGGKIR